MEPQSVNIEQVTAEYQKIIGQLAHDLALTRAALAACQEELDIRPQLPWPPAGGGGAVVTSGIIESTLLTLTISTGPSGGGLYEVWFQCFGSNGTVLADVYQFTLYNGAAVITVAYLKVSSITANSDGKFLVGWVTLPAFTANTLTAKLKRVTGTGTLTALGSAGGPMRLTAKAVIG